MKESYLFDMTLNNIVFEGRNKAYGAYNLRKAYHRHIAIAAILAIAIFSAGLVGPLVNSIWAGDSEKYVKPTYIINEPIVIHLPPPPTIPDPVPEKAPVAPATPEKVEVATAAYAEMKVTRDELVTKEGELANQDELGDVIFGTAKVDGVKPSELDAVIPADDLNGIDGGAEEPAPNAVFENAEILPSFEGGMDDLVKYLSKKLRYPAPAQSAGVEGIVVVSFVVDRNGEINDVKVLKGLGFGTDEEAVRVVKSMPNWNPGRQNGQPVAVRYTLPIKFSLKK